MTGCPLAAIASWSLHKPAQDQPAAAMLARYVFVFIVALKIPLVRAPQNWRGRIRV